MSASASPSSYAELIGELDAVCPFYEHSGSLFDAAVLQRTSRALADTSNPVFTPIQRIFDPWKGQSVHSLHEAAIGPRWTGAWHCLAFRHVDAQLTAAFPSAPHWTGDADAFFERILALAEPHRADVEAFMRHHPQTNETNRCIGLLPAFLLLAQRFPHTPLRCHEMGSSAGLNLLWPHFHYTLDNQTAVTWGSPSSPLHLTTDWRGLPIPPSLASTPISITSALGCDRHPIDLTDDAEVLRLRSYVWSEQQQRADRLLAAIQLAQEKGVRVEQAEAADWVERSVRVQRGSVTVLFHSFLWQYLDEEARGRARRHMENVGGDASEDAPLAWLSMEESGEEKATEGFAKISVKLTVWPGGEEVVVAECHPHCKFVDIKRVEPLQRR